MAEESQNLKVPALNLVVAKAVTVEGVGLRLVEVEERDDDRCRKRVQLDRLVEVEERDDDRCRRTRKRAAPSPSCACAMCAVASRLPAVLGPIAGLPVSDARSTITRLGSLVLLAQPTLVGA